MQSKSVKALNGLGSMLLSPVEERSINFGSDTEEKRTTIPESALAANLTT